jgi:putative ABC transport system substrate-binding protein
VTPYLGQPIRTLLRFLLLALLLLSAPVYGALDSVTVVLSEDGGPYRETAERIKDAMPAGGPRVKIVGLQSQLSLGNAPDIAQAGLIVPVGVRATELVVKAGLGVPVLSVLIPRAAYAQIAGNSSAPQSHALSAIYLDQPDTRRIALIRQALPDRKRVGVLLGPESGPALRGLQSAVREEGLTLVSARIANEDELLPALKRVLTESDVLLAVPDPLIFNRATAQSVLLTSYRAQDPLIAYSHSYVKAGALAAVFSNPAQIGQQAAEILIRLAKGEDSSLPPPQYPKYFSVSVNQQVARSMGIAIEDEAVLHERLAAMEGRE